MQKRSLVIVESPTKAKTIRKFLPKTFVVEASMGHIRDLPQTAADVPEKYKKEAWARTGVNVDKDFEPVYVTIKGKSKIIQSLRALMKESDELFLATDEDREGESISWHLVELLKPKIPVKRMVFHEITKSAIEKALSNSRDIDKRLVQAQETRRILDRLFGFTLSPLIWKKISYGLSAGRVQSVGLRLLVEREKERLKFKRAEYWDIDAVLEKSGQRPFNARLVSIGDQKIASGKDFENDTGQLREAGSVRWVREDEAKALAKKLNSETWKVISVEEKKSTSRPAPPFITSTLQQECNKKIGLSTREAMRVAQNLYEQGLITYMRTDSPNLSSEAIQGARMMIESLYGKQYLSDAPRQFSAKSKGAQEAHEAIRPAGEAPVQPKDSGLSGKHLEVYELIWKRTLATQMAEAKKASVIVRMEAGNCLFGASGTRVEFPGYLLVYADDESDKEEMLLPPLKEGDTLKLQKLDAISHETKPVARFTEASIVQRLEKEGVGRPSTYAAIIHTVLERKYAVKAGNALVPTLTGFAVIQLLEKYFPQLVSYQFTSDMEQVLDEIADGDKEWLPYLREFYSGKEGIRQKVDRTEKEIDAKDARKIDLFPIKDTELLIGRFGAYVVRKLPDGQEIRASLPEEMAPADITVEKIEEVLSAAQRGPESVGVDPETGMKIFCLLGRYGPYVQLGEETEGGPKPKRASVPKEIDYRIITQAEALKLLSLPRVLGNHPTSGNPISANRGRFGPYIVHDGDYRSLKKEDDVFTVSLERALALLAEEKKGRRGSKILKDFGQHPKTKKKISVLEGIYGPYIKYGTKNVSVPKETDVAALTIEKVLELVDAKGK